MASQEMVQKWEAGGYSTQHFAGNLNPPKLGHTGVIADYFGSVPGSV